MGLSAIAELLVQNGSGLPCSSFSKCVILTNYNGSEEHYNYVILPIFWQSIKRCQDGDLLIFSIRQLTFTFTVYYRRSVCL